MLPIERVIERLIARGLRQQGGKFQCPSHDDREPSLSVSVLTEQNARNPKHIGSVQITCHAGCSRASVLSALGLTFADLFPSPVTRNVVTRDVNHLTRNVNSSSTSLVTLGRRPDLGELERRYERGDLVPERVLGELPDDAPPRAVILAEELAFLMGLFAAAGETRPMPCATGWMAERLDWRMSNGAPDKMAVSRALGWLQNAGYIEEAGSLPARGHRYGTKCFAAPLAKGELAERDTELMLGVSGGIVSDEVSFDQSNTVEPGSVAIERAAPEPLVELGPEVTHLGIGEAEEIVHTVNFTPACGRHKGLEWRRDDGPWVCAVCHPPADRSTAEWRDVRELIGVSA